MPLEALLVPRQQQLPLSCRTHQPGSSICRAPRGNCDDHYYRYAPAYMCLVYLLCCEYEFAELTRSAKFTLGTGVGIKLFTDLRRSWFTTFVVCVCIMCIRSVCVQNDLCCLGSDGTGAVSRMGEFELLLQHTASNLRINFCFVGPHPASFVQLADHRSRVASWVSGGISIMLLLGDVVYFRLQLEPHHPRHHRCRCLQHT